MFDRQNWVVGICMVLLGIMLAFILSEPQGSFFPSSKGGMGSTTLRS